MKSFFKRLATILGIVSIVTIVLLLVVASIFEKQIGEKIIATVNEQITTELRVSDFELSILRSFPNVGANLKGVEIDGTDNNVLLQVDEISLRASLFSLFKENLEIESVVIKDGRLYVGYDKKGRNNFDIVKTTEPSTSEDTSSVIDLENAFFENIEIDYQDAQQDNAVLLYVDEANFSGAFGSEQFKMQSEAEINMALVRLEGERMMGEQNISYNIDATINTADGLYQFDQFDLRMGELPLKANGKIKKEKNAYQIDLGLESDGGQLSDLISLLPPQQRNQFEGIESRGEFGLQASILGLYSENKMPEINVDVSFDNGKISGDQIHSPIRDLAFTAKYSNGKRKNNSTSFLHINNFKGDFEGEPFSMSLAINNFDNPDINLAADGQLAVGALMAFLPDERITDGEGVITFRDLNLEGRFSDMTQTVNVSKVKLSGEVGVNRASLTINDEDIQLNRGRLVLNGNDIAISELELIAPGTELTFNGKAVNLLPVIFADSTNSKSAEFIFDATLEASELDIDQLLAFGLPSETDIEEAEEIGQSDSLAQVEIEKRAYYSQFLNGTFKASINEFNYDKIEGRDFEGELIFDSKGIQVKGKTNAMGGDFELDGEMLFTTAPTLEAKLSCHQVHANVFLEQADNFGQELLVADNLEGKMDAHFFIQSAWDEKGNFLDDELHILGGVGIHDGVLKDFKMLEDFSSFVDIRDLRSIHFTNLENFFEIKNNTLYLPVMFIQSNALNLTVSGQHTFEQDIAYFIKVNAGQVMTNKFKGHNTALKPKPARRNGFFNLYYAVLGNIDNYSFSSNKKRVQRDFEESEIRKRDIHFALEKAMGTVIEFVEEPLDWREIPEYEEDPNSTQPEFLDMEIDGGQ